MITSSLYTSINLKRCGTTLLYGIKPFYACLQFAADKCIQINFVAIANSSQDGEAAASELALASFAAGLSDFESASAAYCPCGEQSTYSTMILEHLQI